MSNFQAPKKYFLFVTFKRNNFHTLNCASEPYEKSILEYTHYISSSTNTNLNLKPSLFHWVRLSDVPLYVYLLAQTKCFIIRKMGNNLLEFLKKYNL